MSLFRLFLILTIASTIGSCDTPCDNKVIDFDKHSVCIPKNRDKIIITCYGGASQEIALFAGEKNIAAHPDVTSFHMFNKIYQTLQKLPSVETFDDVNLETLIKYNPDIVFAGATSTRMNEKIKSANTTLFTLDIGKHSIQTLLDEFLAVGNILNNPALSKLQAVLNKDVYQAPVGTFWWDRPSPESILGILWLSKIIYPQQFSDIDLMAISKDFYKKFYNYTLSDDEYKSFFAQKEALR